MEPRYVHCGDVTGVYEPAILVAEAVARRTAWAAEPGAVIPPLDCFHETCYTRTQRRSPR